MSSRSEVSRLEAPLILRWRGIFQTPDRPGEHCRTLPPYRAPEKPATKSLESQREFVEIAPAIMRSTSVALTNASLGVFDLPSDFSALSPSRHKKRREAVGGWKKALALHWASGCGMAQRRHLHHDPKLPPLRHQSSGISCRYPPAIARDDHQPSAGTTASPVETDAAIVAPRNRRGLLTAYRQPGDPRAVRCRWRTARICIPASFCVATRGCRT